MPVLPDRVWEALTYRRDVSGAPPVRQDWVRAAAEEEHERSGRARADGRAGPQRRRRSRSPRWSGGRDPRRASRARARSSPPTGSCDGWIGGACAEPVVIREAKQVMADGNARLLLLGSPDQFGAAVPEGMTVVPISCQSEGALEIYIEPVLPVPHLVIVGSSPMAHTLAELARALAGPPTWSARRVHAGARGRAVDGRRRHPGARRRGHDRARGRDAPGLPGPGRVAPPWQKRCSATSPSAACPRTSSTRCTPRPAWTSARRVTRRWPSRSSRSWSSCARPARFADLPRAGPERGTHGAEARAEARRGRRPGLRDDGHGGRAAAMPVRARRGHLLLLLRRLPPEFSENPDAYIKAVLR